MTKFYLHPSRYLTVLFLMVFSVAWSQTRTISGKVTGEDGSGIPGVNILEKGTANGTVTDVQGNYTISVAGSGSTIVFTFVGYKSQEVAVGNQTSIPINLQPDVTALSEVVVIGYGQQEKKDITGAMSTVSSENFNKGVITSPDQLFQGKVAGVQITSSSGDPGAGVNITIRGASSFRSGNNPLIVVDGFPLDGSPTNAASTQPNSSTNGAGIDDAGLGMTANKNPLSFLNPDDIKSVDILKDASATAIYGSRGANGVILITTKKGQQKGRGSVSYSAYVSAAALPSGRKIDLLNASEYPDRVAAAGANPTAANFGGATDWQDQVFRTGITHGHSLSFGGGDDKTNYRASLSYQDQQGIVEVSDMKRITARINGVHTFIEDKLKLDFQLSAANTSNANVPISNNAGFQGSLIGALLQANPTMPIRHAAGGTNGTRTWQAGDYTQANESENGQGISQDFRNPLALLEYVHDRDQNMRLLGNIGVTWKITKNLEYRLNAGIDNSSSVRRVFYDPRLRLGGTFDTFNGRVSIYHRYLNSPLIENYLTYNTNIGDAKFTALVGHSFQTFSNQGDFFGAQNFPTSDFFLGYDNVTGGKSPDPNQNPFGSDNKTSKLQSFFGRVNYSLNDKYLVTATLRADGSSKFGSDNRYGYFPSFAFGWRLSEESFIPDAFQDLKLRAGWGITGNQLGIPAGVSKANYTVDPVTHALTIQTAANHGIKWEQTQQLNLGFDFTLLEGRLSGTLDYFHKNTKDLLLQLNLAQPAPTQFAWQNLPANVVNSGIEFSLDGVIMDKNGFRFNANVNYTYYIDQAVVKNLGNSFYNTGAINGQGLSNAYAQRIANNQTLGEFYMQEYTGLDEAGHQTFANDSRLTYVGSSQPKSIIGLTLNFTYKRWDLSTVFNARYGAMVYNNTANALYLKGSLANGRNVTKEVGYSNEAAIEAPIVSTRYLEKGDFIRMSNLSLGYNFGSVGRAINSLRLYATGQNVFLITKYTGYDPEVNVDKNMNGIPSVGIDYTAFPRARTFTLGLNATF